MAAPHFKVLATPPPAPPPTEGAAQWELAVVQPVQVLSCLVEIAPTKGVRGAPAQSESPVKLPANST